MSTRSATKTTPGGTSINPGGTPTNPEETPTDPLGTGPDSPAPSSPTPRVTRQSRRATFECEDCGKKFLTEQMKTRHSLIHSGEKPHGCELCGRQFRRTDELQRHKTRHSREDGICCFVCNAELDSSTDLVGHMKTHAINFKSKVSSAGYTFRSSSVVKTYRDLYRSDNPQPCYVCFTEFPGCKELLEHLGQHTAVELLKGSSDRELWKSSSSYAELQYVKWRRRRASSLNGLKSRGRRATSDKPEPKSEFTHVCRVCHQMFKGVESLLSHWMERKGRSGHDGAVGGEGYDTHCIHMHYHGRRLGFRCDLCGETFNSVTPTASHLEVHADTEVNTQLTDTHLEVPVTDTEEVTEPTVKIEEEEKEVESEEDQKILFHMSDESDGELDPNPSGKFECYVCMKVAKCKSALRRHMMIHKEEKPFLCPVCGKQYARPEDLKQHLIRHVADLYQQGNSTDPNSRFRCDLCTAVFCCEKDLQYHGVYHGVYRPNARAYVEGQSTVCPICGKMLQKATSLPSHIELHTQDRKYDCGLCGRTFKSERNRNRHQKIHTGVKEFVCEVCGKGLSRKAEYDAHLNRHNTDPTFNGKAGRKRGTKVINNKVIYSKEIYRSPEDKMAAARKPKTRVVRRDQKVLHLDSNGEVLLDMSGLSGVTHSLLSLPEKSIIPLKNKKRKMGMVMVDDTTESPSTGHQVVLQSVETQTEVLTPEQSSLAHNIDIINSELTEPTNILTSAEVTSVDGVSAAEDEAIIIIVQDPTTGENEVLTIKSFQEGASKLISPNEELMKALESFQKNKSLDEMTTLPAGNSDGSTLVKTEVLDHPEDEAGDEELVTMATSATTLDDAVPEILGNVTSSTATQDPLHPGDKVSVPEHGDKMSVQRQDDKVSVMGVNQPQLPAIKVSADQATTPSGDGGQLVNKPVASSHHLIDSSPSSVPPAQTDNLNVKVVSFTLDETTGILVPIYPEKSSLTLSVIGDRTAGVATDTIPVAGVATDTIPGPGAATDSILGAGVATDTILGADVATDTIPGESVAMDTINEASVAADTINEASVAMDTSASMVTLASGTSKLRDSSETAMTSMLLNTDGDLTAVEALMQMKSPQHAGLRPHLVGPGGDRTTCTDVVQKSVSVPVLKCTPDGRVIKTPAGAPAIFKSVKLSPTLPSSPPGKALQAQSAIVSTLENPVADDEYYVGDDGDDISNDDEIMEEPVRKKRRTKKDAEWIPAKPVRKSLRNSYEGVSKIVASLRRQKKHPRETVKKMKAKADVAAADAADIGGKENGEPDREFVKCNICRSLQPWEDLRHHIDTEHGANAYQCGLCSQGYDNNVDLHMHLLGHEKDDRIKRTLSLLSGDTEVRKQLVSAGGSPALSGEASAAILALERGGDLKEVLATVEVDVEDLINTDTKTNNKDGGTNIEDIVNIDTKTRSKDGMTIVTMSNVRSGVEHDLGDRGSSQNPKCVRTSTETNQEDVCVDSSSSTKTSANRDYRIKNSSSTETTSSHTECSDDAKQDGDCAACRESFMSSFSLKKQNSELPMKQHTCGRMSSEGCSQKEEGEESRECLTCVCGLCGYRFVNVNLLTRHVKAHYREKPFSCDMCNKKYARRDELVKHRMSHQAVVVHKPKQERRKFLPRSKTGKYPCHLCKEQFKTYQSRYTHVLCHESDKASTCEKVDSYKPKDKSSSHKPTDKSSVTCDVCGLVLSGPRHLVRHKLIHTNERPWLCQECGKSFLRSDDLRVHQRRQHGNIGNSDTNRESKFRKVCPFCKRVFTSFNSFRNHVKTHKSERLDGSLKCDICGKVFIKHISLRNHQQIHKNTYRRGMKRNTTVHKPATLTYNCEDCGKQIKSKSNFVRHMKLHNEGKHYICSKCTKGFARQADLRMHERLHTGERPFLCNLCGKGFTSNSALSHHVKMHNQPVVYKYSCTQCEGLFASRKEFKDHVKNCTPKQMEIVFIQETEAVPIETIEYL
ncbi:uncharacterized protein [Haliotis cracherodii]|uniref:uncharacterized protein n=1 Tax=Haliotis cracherodii TaxID=6455 RepID=UPI0039E7C135